MKPRYAVWLILPGLLVLILMITNPHVSYAYHAAKVQPFVLMAFAKLVLVAVLIVQHPGPPPGVARWRVWRWMDPLTLLLVGMLVGSTIYFVMLWGGNGQRFKASPVGYDIARWILWIDGYALLTVGCELLYRGVRSRLHNRRERQERYDIRDAGGEA